MRLATLGLLLAALSFAGCSNGPQPEEPLSQTSTNTDSLASKEEPAATPAPAHPVGRAWTFEGHELYNPDHEFTVVVARADATGYLFAGGAPDDLVYDALWQSPWFGERKQDMDRKDWENNVLEFPLHDGKTWTYYGNQTVTATAARVDTPGGETEGFRIEGERVSYDYSIPLGQIVRWERMYANGQLGESLRLVSVAEGVEPLWYDAGTLVSVFTPQDTSAFEVGSGYDAVIASAGGIKGARALLSAPSGKIWNADFSSTEESWTHGEMAAEPGPWTASVLGRPYIDGAPPTPVEPPIGWGAMRARPITWV